MKPDDVKCIDPTFRRWAESGMTLREYIDRAIIRARSQAFEEASKIAEEHRERDLGEASNDYAAGHFVASGRIAQAIRQHSQKGEDVNE
jgi:hypothetical protein